MPNWPASLPQEPTLGSIQQSPPSGNVIRSPMDIGPAKLRRRTSSSPEPWPMTFAQVTETQRLAFIDFFVNDLADGTLRFDMPHPLTGVDNVWRFRADQAPYSIVPTSRTEYQISVNLEKLP